MAVFVLATERNPATVEFQASAHHLAVLVSHVRRKGPRRDRCAVRGVNRAPPRPPHVASRGRPNRWVFGVLFVEDVEQAIGPRCDLGHGFEELDHACCPVVAHPSDPEMVVTIRPSETG